MAKIGFIGMGNIGYAIMRSLLNKYKTEDITFTDLNRRRVAQIEKETGVKAVDTNQDCAENAKYIVLAIKPQFYDNVLADIKDHVTKENIIISIAPGITIDSVNEKLGGDRRIVRAMPNTPALIGEGMTGVCYDKKLFEETEKQMIFWYDGDRSGIYDECGCMYQFQCTGIHLYVHRGAGRCGR